MTQKDFSDIVKDYLRKHYPDFLNNISIKDDQSFDCSIKNQRSEFSVWLATYNEEITLGLEDSNQDSNCHTHMSFFGNEPIEQLDAMTKYLDDIFSNRLIAFRSSVKGFSWTSNRQQTLEEKKPAEAIDFFTWTDF
jgi:hypothetical protein